MQASRLYFACLLATLLAPRASVSWAAEPTPEQLEFFEKKIRPVLVEKCVECHGADAQESELRVDSLRGLLQGGTRGPAVAPGNAKESLLIRAVGHGETLQMPPKKKLPPAQIADLTEWVKQGVPWPVEKTLPDEKPQVAKAKFAFTEKHKSHWAFQPVLDPSLPSVRNAAWPETALDRFILARLESAGLSPAPQADRRKLVRRATFDLTGLPPTVAESQDFLADESPDAYDRLLDRLLASPRYGEKYGRHWLDLARYADSNGLDENLAYANAFRYRDYVIAAFNKDKPYDRFLQEQLAGDLAPHANLDSELEGLVATGFLSLGAKMLAEDDPVKMQMDIIDEQIDTLGKCFMGLTLGCARCHDHKFDPIDLPDYYGLAGIFKSTKTMVNHSVVAVWQERPLADKETLARRDAAVKQVAAKRGEANSLVSSATQALLDAQRSRAGEYLWAAHVRQTKQDTLAKALPLGDLPAEKRATIAGLQILEAENYSRGNVIKDTTSYGEGIGVLVNRGETPNFAEYDLEIPQAGGHQLELRYAAAGARPCKVFVNGKLVLGNAASQVTGGWKPAEQKWFVEGVLELPAGKVTIRLEQPTFFPHIDKLLIAPRAGDVAEKSPAESTAPDLKEEFVHQWQQTLERSRADAASVFAPWHVYLAGKDANALTDANAQKLAALLDLATVKTPRELAERYGRLFAAADAEWRSLRATAAGKDAKALSDPVQESLRQVLYGAAGPLAAPKKIELLLASDVQEKVQQLRESATALEAAAPKIPEAMAVGEAKAEDLRIHFRGNHLTLGEVAPRRFLRIVAGDSQPLLAADRSGRWEFAQWLTQPEHPLTARVMANRLWQWHFGEGLVRSSDNFGLLGESPSHPELLDWLARRLVEDGWSLKKMHRRLMTSATYEQAVSTARSPATAAPEVVDPDNRLLSRFSRRRLQAEEIRDGILAVSGGLNLQMGGSYLTTPNRQYVTSTANVNPAIYNQFCRSVYMPVVRSALYEVFQAFDFADPSVLIGRRDATTVAPQALFMLNSQITAEACRALAAELLAASDLDDASRVQALFERTYGHPASTADVARALAFVERYAAVAQSQALPAEEARRKAWQALCRSVLAANEFVYVE